LPRRANHLHKFNIENFEPAPGNRPRAFSIEWCAAIAEPIVSCAFSVRDGLARQQALVPPQKYSDIIGNCQGLAAEKTRPAE
jgi:hypothetical protein